MDICYLCLKQDKICLCLYFHIYIDKKGVPKEKEVFTNRGYLQGVPLANWPLSWGLPFPAACHIPSPWRAASRRSWSPRACSSLRTALQRTRRMRSSPSCANGRPSWRHSVPTTAPRSMTCWGECGWDAWARGWPTRPWPLLVTLWGLYNRLPNLAGPLNHLESLEKIFNIRHQPTSYVSNRF